MNGKREKEIPVRGLRGWYFLMQTPAR